MSVLTFPQNPAAERAERARAPEFAAVAWIEQQIDEWILARIAGREWQPGALPDHPVLIRKKEVIRRVGFSYPTIWALEKAGRFPPRIKLTANLDEQRPPNRRLGRPTRRAEAGEAVQ